MKQVMVLRSSCGDAWPASSRGSIPECFGIGRSTGCTVRWRSAALQLVDAPLCGAVDERALEKVRLLEQLLAFGAAFGLARRELAARQILLRLLGGLQHPGRFFVAQALLVGRAD